MDDLNPEFARLLAAKEARRQRLARAPFPEKIAALIGLQMMASPIQRRRGRGVVPWRIQGLRPVRAEATLMLNEEAPPYGVKLKPSGN
ncbi:MAG: hypothetical protein HY360_24545 [Verrucomicrobia bacterium]|nr:hypothetical protein [Verrucomicrobiota bacterium]